MSTAGTKERKATDIVFRKSFPQKIIWGGYGLMASGACFLIAGVSIVGGLVLIVMGGIFSFSFSGVLLDVKNREAKQYTSVFGYKYGTWIDLRPYPFISILKSRTSYRSKKFTSGMGGDEISYDIYLITADHKDRFLVKVLSDEVSARLSARELGSALGVQYANFHPKE